MPHLRQVASYKKAADTMISFTVDMDPPRATHHRKSIKRIGKRLAVLDDPELKVAKQILALHFKKHRPKSPMDGPLKLHISIRFPWLKSHTKAQRQMQVIPKTTAPDCSNLAKTIEDVLAD